jgi:hypothetical protein
MSGAIDIRDHDDGSWSVAINGEKARRYKSLAAAIEQAGNVQFAPGEVPGSWRVLITER